MRKIDNKKPIFHSFKWEAIIGAERYGAEISVETAIGKQNIEDTMPYIFRQIKDSLLSISRKQDK